MFRADKVTPVMSGKIPPIVNQLVSRICNEQLAVLEGINNRNVDEIFTAFSADPLVSCGLNDAKKLFDEMVSNTAEYLSMYNLQ